MRLRSLLDSAPPRRWPALPGRTNHLEAGVLVPLVWSDQPTILAILRAADLRRHANEVAFPGGKPEPEDSDIVATALREANEELGFDEVDVLGRLSSWPLYTSDYRLEPVVGVVHERQLVADPGEVAEVLRFDVRAWLAHDTWRACPTTTTGSGGSRPSSSSMAT